ncbi:hypothetical protein OUZ56_017309 [Daphnia magna]|uniref:Uncharacterized protein n=1 Tax=Daphnia magna TaxID=35525 RepID=A0ABR0ASQ6_9CRUS|nr:hypothetical protein OUZ56_017309 [Daphnia magna]
MKTLEESPAAEPTEENEEYPQLRESSTEKKGAIKQPKSYFCLFTCPIRPSNPRLSGNAKNRVDFFCQHSPMDGRVLEAYGADHKGFTEALQWSCMFVIRRGRGVVKKLLTSRDRLIRSVMNLINSTIQSLRPLELREEQPEDVEVPPIRSWSRDKKRYLYPCHPRIWSNRKSR